ncbi:hypothetical protein Bhyg_03627, partial [Pseudolycoriella hygida]
MRYAIFVSLKNNGGNRSGNRNKKIGVTVVLFIENEK